MRAEAEGRWQDALGTLGRNSGPYVLDAWWPDLTGDERRQLILGVWEVAEWPADALSERRWLAMFKAIGFISDGPEQPSEPVELWRGAPVESKGRGMSWSVDRAVAELFAARWNERFHVPATVFKVALPPEAILAFNGFSEESRGEREAIVNPSMLRGRITAL